MQVVAGVCDDSDNCPEPWLEHHKYCYAKFDIILDQQNSLDYCAVYGGDLVSFGGQGEHNFVKANYGGEYHYWIGLRRVEDNFVWSDETLLGYTNWSDIWNESNANCVALTPSFDWRTQECSTPHRFICEVPEKDIIVPLIEGEATVKPRDELCTNTLRFDKDCVSMEMMKIYNHFHDHSSHSISDVLLYFNDLQVVAANNITLSDLVTATDIVLAILEIDLDSLSPLTMEEFNSVAEACLQTVSQLLSDTSSAQWALVQEENQVTDLRTSTVQHNATGKLISGDDSIVWKNNNTLYRLLRCFEKFTLEVTNYLINTNESSFITTTDNLDVEINIQDTNTANTVTIGSATSSATFPAELLRTSQSDKIGVVITLFRSLNQILPDQMTLSASYAKLGSDVISVSQYPSLPTPFAAPVILNITLSKFSARHRQALELITVIGCSISLVCLLCTFGSLIYFRLHSERIIILHNLVLMLAFAQLMFLVSGLITHDTKVCAGIAICLHYLFLAAFFWMLVQGIQLYLKVSSVFAPSNSVLPYYFLLGYGTPAVIVGITVATKHAHYGNELICWLSTEDGVVYAFVGPVICIIIINLVVLILVLRAFMGVKVNEAKTEKERLRSGVRACMILLPILGLTWIFGILAFNKETLFFAYLFALLNSSQGVFIFILHCACNDEVKSMYKKRFKSKISTSAHAWAANNKSKSKSTSTTTTASEGVSVSLNTYIKKSVGKQEDTSA
uniref:Uncharacterized protein LOC102806617 n=1 Tax=Saccoglossus kowalevskii TaxID=10224 RepID=A0ABM0M207_SACKO|nr:PREDICTED: uncharacterized protein LOC102806617 [Saccoglossus kowalevskii]